MASISVNTDKCTLDCATETIYKNNAKSKYYKPFLSKLNPHSSCLCPNYP